MYRESFTVMPSEAGCAGEIKARALLNRLQDTASMAVIESEGPPGELMRRGYAWVLLRYWLEVEKRLPAMDESVVVETRHTANDGFHTLRAFRVFAEKNEAETLLLAKTSWVLIDLAAGRPVRASQRLPEIFQGLENDPPIDPEFNPIPKLSGAALKNQPVLRETDFPVRFHDLDSNGHVNNAVYFEWLYEATPLDLMGCQLLAVNAEFRVSAKFGDTVRVKVKETAPYSANGKSADNNSANDELDSKIEKAEKAERKARAFVYEMSRAGAEPSDGHSLARFYALWAIG